MTMTVSKTGGNKMNADIIANGAAAKGPVKQFFAKMLDKAGISKFKAWVANRREARDSKVTYLMNVSKEDQKTIADNAKESYHLNQDAFAAFNYNPYLDRFSGNL